MLLSAVLGWGVCCACYGFAACTAFRGPAWLVAPLAGWQWFYSAWHSVAFSAVLFPLLVLSATARKNLFSRSAFILVGLVGGVITWPLGVILWSIVIYQHIYFPWLRPDAPEDIPVAGILGLSVTTFYGLLSGSYAARTNA